MPKLYNLREDVLPKTELVEYIGRGSVWGNPFVIGKHGTREEVISLYEDYLSTHPELVEKAILELKGKPLACFCAPEKCHGDILMSIANGGFNDKET